MSRPNVVVTGANRGIGLAVSRALLARGCRVLMVARAADEGRRLERELRGDGDVRFVPGDLSTVASMRSAAAAIREACPAIDVLVHNAGIWPTRRETTADGLERGFAVNHLAPFVLNRLLEDALPAGGRVVQVSAGLYVKGRVDPARTPVGSDFHPLRTYPTTKLCNLLLLERFAERFGRRGVTINAVHPGVIRTGLGDTDGAVGAVLRIVKLAWRRPEEGAPPIVRLALDPALDGVSGRFFDRERERSLAACARERSLADALWEQAEAVAGLDRS